MWNRYYTRMDLHLLTVCLRIFVFRTVSNNYFPYSDYFVLQTWQPLKKSDDRHAIVLGFTLNYCHFVNVFYLFRSSSMKPRPSPGTNQTKWFQPIYVMGVFKKFSDRITDGKHDGDSDVETAMFGASSTGTHGEWLPMTVVPSSKDAVRRRRVSLDFMTIT